MKRIVSLVAVLCALVAASCDKYDDTEVKDAIASLQVRMEALEKLNVEVAALKQIIDGKVTIISCLEDDGIYTITLSDGKVLHINSGMLHMPVVTFLNIDGKLCWAYYLDGKVEPVMNGGKPIQVLSSATPQIRANSNGYLEISMDEGKTWIETEAMVGNETSNSLFSAVEKKDDFVLFTLADGVTQYAVPVMKEGQVEFMTISGKQFFTYGQCIEVPVEMIGIDNFTITERPEGWKTTLVQGKLTITAPAEGVGDVEGCIKMLGVGKETMIAQIYVAIGTAPCAISISDEYEVTITPSGKLCFYGATLLEDFDPKAIAAEHAAVINPLTSRKPYTEVEYTTPLENMVGDVVEGETYVVWAMPAGAGATEEDVLYQVVSSIGITAVVSNVGLDDATLTVGVKGTETYYLVPMSGDMTLDNVIADLNGTYTATYDRYKHTSTFRGTLTDLVDIPRAGEVYNFLVLPVKFGNVLSAEAETFNVQLASYTFGGSSAVILQQSAAEFNSLTVSVKATGAYKVFAGVVSAVDYDSNGYADDSALMTWLLERNPKLYEGEYTFKTQGLQSGDKYWAVAVAVDRKGVLGAICRQEVATKTVEYSNVQLTMAEPVLTLTSALMQMSSTGEISRYRYLLLSTDAGGYWYGQYVDNDEAVYKALIYGTCDYQQIDASAVADGISFNSLEFGIDYIFRVIGYDKDGKITNMGKVDFTPSVGKVVRFDDAKWQSTKPEVKATITKNTIKLNVVFNVPCKKFIVTKMSTEEYAAHMPLALAPRQKTDYVVGHSSANEFYEDLVNYNPGWYISSDKPLILIAWEDESGWYEPLVFNSATGKVINGEEVVIK